MHLLLSLIILLVTSAFACGCMDADGVAHNSMSAAQWGYIGLAIFLQLLPYLWVTQRASGAQRLWRRRALLTLAMALTVACGSGLAIVWLENWQSLVKLMLLLFGFGALYFPGYVLCWRFHRSPVRIAPAAPLNQ